MYVFFCIFSPIDLCGWAGGIFICLLYIVSLANVCRVLYLCASTEPGIIPKIRSKSVNYVKPYKVTYQDADDRDDVVKQMQPVEAFFSLKSFKVVTDE